MRQTQKSNRGERLILSWILAIALVLSNGLPAMAADKTRQSITSDLADQEAVTTKIGGSGDRYYSQNVTTTTDGYGGALNITANVSGTILPSFEGNYVTNSNATTSTGTFEVTGGGGAIYNLASKTIAAITSNFSGNHADTEAEATVTSGDVRVQANAYGGAIYNGGSITDITNASFTDNYVFAKAKATSEAASGNVDANAYTYGGAIYNADSGIIGSITNSSFIGNKAKGEASATGGSSHRGGIYGRGGAIYNDGTINSITNTRFIGNSATYDGGAISNAGTINSVTNTRFIGNSSGHQGGAIRNADSATIGSIISSYFEGNSSQQGGAIFDYNSTNKINIEASCFMGNYTFSKSNSEQLGGAIRTKILGSIKDSSFEGNYILLSRDNGIAFGGAICVYGTIDSIEDSSFTGNYINATGANNMAYGGAIQCKTVTNGIIDSTFTGNYALATGASSEAKGGAIYIEQDLLIKSQDKDVTFKGNYVKAAEMTMARGSAIFVASESETLSTKLTLQANSGRKITFGDDQTIEGTNKGEEYSTGKYSLGYVVDVNGGGTVEFLQENAANFKEGSGIYGAAEVSVYDGTTLAISNITTDKLTLNNGNVDFTRDSKVKAYNFPTINLTGNGNLKLDVDLAEGKMDSITGSVTGSGELHITALALLKDALQDETPVIFTTDASVKSVTQYKGREEISSHTNKYKVGYNDGVFTFTKSGVSDTTIATGDTVNVMNFVWLETVNNLQKRLGDLRGGEESDMAWARFQRSNDDYDGARKFNVSGNMYQVGYDFVLKNQVASRGYFGVSLEAFDGTQSYAIGGGDVKSMSLGAYYTKIYDSGHYFDFILRYGRLENDSTSYDATAGLSGILTKLDYAMNSVTLSGEYGYRWNMGKSGLYLEPQAEFIYGYLSGAQATSSTNYLADIDSTNHFVTRLGLAFGQRVKNFNYYLRGSYYHDFAGTIHVKYGGTPYQQDSAQNWWEVSLGGGWNISKLSYFYAELTKHFKDVSNSLNFNVGFRFTL